MHGIIHVVFKSYVEVTWSAAAWVACLRKANLMDDETLLSPIGHPDSHSWALFNAACEQRDLPMDELLEQFGYFFVEYVVEEGYITFLHSMGRNLFELISNINMLHNTVLKGEKAVVFPLLEVSHISGDPEAPDHRFRLCYGSNRAGLAVFLLGIVRGVAHILFNSKVNFKDTSTEDPASLPMMTVQHSWVVTVKRNPEGMPETPKRTKSKPGNFFEFHSFVSSIFSCHCEPCDETSRSQMKSQEMGPEVRSIVLEKQEDIERIMEAYNGLEEHDESYESLVSSLSMPDRVRMAAVLFRGIYAKHVAAPWNELEQRPDVADFWDVQGHGDNCYRISKDWLGGGETMAGTRIKNGYIIFVSHCWNAPTGWAQTMKRTSFPQTKAAELCSYAKEAAKALYGDAASWGRLGFWIDKACIPQSDPNMMALSVNLLEEFIALSDGMIVLASWNYFSRMWCVYEWVCGLLIHSAMQIEIVADQLIRDSTLDTYLLCIRNFSVARCNCNSERDRQILIDKVEAYYKSVEDFEKFFQFSVIVCFCRFVAKRRTSKSNMLIPWAELASACGFSTLAKHMRRLSQVLPRFHTEAARTVQGCTDDVQAALGSLVDDWFTTNIAPLLLEEEVKATNHLGMTYITSLRLMTESAKQSEETLPQFLERIENLHGELLRTKRRALHSDAFLPFKNSVVAKKREPPSRERSWEFGTTTVGTIVSTDDSSTALSAFMRSAALRHRA